MKSDYSELIDIFERISKDSNRLVEIFKAADESERVSPHQYYVWHLCEIEEPKKSGYYTIAVDTIGMTRYIDIAFYNNNLMCWTVNSDPASELYEKVYDFAPMAWTKIEFPDYLRGK